MLLSVLVIATFVVVRAFDRIFFCFSFSITFFFRFIVFGFPFFSSYFFWFIPAAVAVVV